MAIEDGIICRVQPLPSASTLIDTFDAVAFTGAGTTSATTEGGEDAVRLQNGLVGKSIPDHTVDTTVISSGMTIVVRYKAVELAGGGSFDTVFGVVTDSADIPNTTMVAVTKNGNTDLRAKGWLNKSVSVPSVGETGTVHTLVVQAVAPSGVDGVLCWENQSPAVPDRAPDFVKQDFFGAAGAKVVNFATLGLPATSDLIILDYIVWDRELTNAESSDVADDIRSQLPVQGGGSVPAGITTVGTITTTETTADVNYSYNDTDQTGFKYRLDGGSLVDVALVNPFTIPGLTQDTAYTVEVLAYNATGDGVLSTPATNFTTDAAVIPSITTDPLRNNTGQLLASEVGVIADVYDITNGDLVVRKTGLTSNASGVVTFTDAAMSAATVYRVVITLSGDEEGIARITSV